MNCRHCFCPVTTESPNGGFTWHICEHSAHDHLAERDNRINAQIASSETDGETRRSTQGKKDS